MAAAFTGFLLGLSLILAIGAQNAFVLRQGLRRTHVFWVCLTCAASDAVLIAAGVGGFGWLVEAAPWIAPVMRWLGAAFLLVYGALALRAAIRGTSAMAAAESKSLSLSAAILTTLALTWLNPHVYLDTVVLLGSIAATEFPGQRFAFGTGAVISSFVFFFSLGYGARVLTPLFERPSAWRVLDFLICVVMWAIAAGLVFKG